jgi:DNA polymerase-3 subunit alpha
MEQAPVNFRDLIAINSLIRPGTGDWNEYIARRKGKPWNVHPHRMPYLKETEGLITYQEQFLLDCKVLAGWDIAFADKKVRKNKDITNDHELRKKFLDDTTERGYNLDEMVMIWDEIVHSVAGGYSFNKSHSASYAVISYQTAWLKYYYPEHFYASLMTSDNAQDAVAGYIAECKQRGIAILPPDVNLSGDTFFARKEGINYRITTIKHVGESAIEAIKAMRPIKDFEDFLQRRPSNTVKKNICINLIKAGCFDFCNRNRAELLWKFDMSQRTKTQIKNDFQCALYEWNDKIKAEWEKEVLGMYLSIHPLERYGFKSLSEYADGGRCIQGGEVYDVRTLIDKNKNEMAFVFINTLYGNVKVLCFASIWINKSIREAMKIGNILLVKGKRSGTDVLLDEVEVLE